MPEDKIDFKKVVPINGSGSRSLGFVDAGPSTSQYDVGAKISDLSNLNAYRSYKQPKLDELGNMGTQILSTVLGQTVSSFGSLTDGIYNLVAKNDIAPDAGLSGAGQNIVEWGTNEFPIYYDPNKAGLNGDGISYVMSRMPSVASSLSMLLPGMGVSKLFGGLGRALRLGSDIEKVLAVGAGSIAMRHAENWMESGQLYRTLMSDFIKGENNSGANPGLKVMNQEDADKSAKIGSTHDYKMNWTNLAFDVLQLSLIAKPITGMFSKILGGESKLASTLDYGLNTTKARGLLEGASKAEMAALRGVNIVAPFTSQFSEGIEEGVNQVSQYEGARKAGIDAGTIKDDGSSLTDRITNDYIKRGDTKDAFAWGIIGGTAFHMIGSAINNTQNQHGFWNNVTEQGERLASIAQRQEVVSEYAKVLEDPKSTQYDKTVAKHNLVFNLVQNNRQSDTLDMLKADMQNPKYMATLAKNMGSNTEDFMKDVPQMVKDMEWINKSISEYEGGSWNDSENKKYHSPFSKKSQESTDVSIPVEDNEQEKYKSSNRRVGNFADPKLAMQLAYNDYSMLVRDRINDAAKTELGQVSHDLYNHESLSPNAQSYLNLTSDLKGLNATRQVYKDQLQALNDLEEKGLILSSTSKGVQENIVKKLDTMIAEKEKLQQGYKKMIEDNLKDPLITSETALEKLKELEDNQLAGSKIISKKTVYYTNQAEKQITMDLNKRILENPKKFEQDKIEDMRNTKVFTQAQANEQKATLDAAAEAQTLIDGLTTLPKYKEHYANAKAQIEKNIAERDDNNSASYVLAEFQHIDKLIADAKKDGRFYAKSAEDFEKNFDKDLYMQLMAKREALRDMQPKGAPAKASSKTTTAAKAKTEKNAYRDYPAGTAPKTYAEFASGNNQFKSDWNDEDILAAAPLVNAEEEQTVFLEAQKRINDLLESISKATSDSEKEILADRVYDIFQPLGFANGYSKKDDFNNKMKQVVPKAVVETEKMSAVPTLPEILNGRIENNAANIAALDLPTLNNPFLLSLPSMLSKTKTVFRDFFMSAIPGTYPTLRDVAENVTAVNKILTEEEDRLKDEADAFIKDNAQPNNGPVKIGRAFNEDMIDEAMDKQKSVKSNRTPQRTDRYAKDREMAAGSNEAYTVDAAPIQFKTTTNPDGTQMTEENRDSLGRNTPNAYDEKTKKGYAFWAGHYLDKDGKPGKGFVKAGDVVILKNAIETNRFTKEEYKTIEIYNDGVWVGNMDTSARLNKAITKNNSKLKELKGKKDTKSTAQTKTITDKNNMLKELHALYEDIEKQMLVATGPMEITVKQKVTSQLKENSSGGVYFGDMFMTEVKTLSNGEKVTKPISSYDAFGDTVNTNGGAILTVAYGDSFFVNNENNVSVDISKKFPNIYIPESIRKELNKSPDKSLNSQVFAAIPTNVLNAKGEHIYIPVRLYTLTQNDSRITQDGKEGGPSLGEAIFDSMMNPDADKNVFGMLVEAAGLSQSYKPGLGINEQSKDFIMSFYTTENLVGIFNKVSYVYNEAANPNPTPNADYSNHIGLSVFYPEGSFLNEQEQEAFDAARKKGIPLTEKEKAMGFPFLRMNLSNDAKVKNTFAIRLFDDAGKFSPVMNEKTAMRGVTMTTKEREQADASDLPITHQKINIDVKAFIKSRLNQKKFRIDKKRISDSLTAGKYSGFAFKNGKLTYDKYDSYVQYISENRFLDSTVHGIRMRTTDGRESMNFFQNRSIWFEKDLKPAGNKSAATASKTPGKKVRTVSRTGKKTVTANNTELSNALIAKRQLELVAISMTATIAEVDKKALADLKSQITLTFITDEADLGRTVKEESTFEGKQISRNVHVGNEQVAIEKDFNALQELINCLNGE